MPAAISSGGAAAGNYGSCNTGAWTGDAGAAAGYNTTGYDLNSMYNYAQMYEQYYSSQQQVQCTVVLSVLYCTASYCH